MISKNLTWVILCFLFCYPLIGISNSCDEALLEKAVSYKRDFKKYKISDQYLPSLYATYMRSEVINELKAVKDIDTSIVDSFMETYENNVSKEYKIHNCDNYSKLKFIAKDRVESNIKKQTLKGITKKLAKQKFAKYAYFHVSEPTYYKNFAIVEYLEMFANHIAVGRIMLFKKEDDNWVLEKIPYSFAG
jgi:hypothetical protein